LSSPIDKKFKELREAIAKQRNRLHTVSATEHNAHSAAFYDKSELLQRSKHQRELKEWLNAPDYEGDFRAANKLHYQGTCDWLHKKQALIEWTTSTDRPFLFIYGIPGAGKTVLSSWFINEARSAGASDGLILFHYFKDTDTNKRTSASAIRSLVDQLMNHCICTNDPLMLQLEPSLNEISLQRTRHADYDDLWGKIFSVAALAFIHAKDACPSPIVTVVLDAMDECQSPGTLIKDLLALTAQSRGKFRVLVTGRKSAWDRLDLVSPTASPTLNSLWRTYSRTSAPLCVTQSLASRV